MRGGEVWWGLPTDWMLMVGSSRARFRGLSCTATDQVFGLNSRALDEIAVRQYCEMGRRLPWMQTRDDGDDGTIWVQIG